MHFNWNKGSTRMFCHRTLTITDMVTQYAYFSVPHGVHL